MAVSSADLNLSCWHRCHSQNKEQVWVPGCAQKATAPVSLSIQVFSWGSDWRRLYQDNLAQKSTTFFFILRGSWAVPNKLEYHLSFFFVRKGFCILGQCLLVRCGTLQPGLRYECQALKALMFAEIRETVSAVVFHSPRFLRFQDSTNGKLN